MLLAAVPAVAAGQDPSPATHRSPAHAGLGVNQAMASRPSASLPEMPAWEQQQCD